MANRNWASAGKIYTMHGQPSLIDCNFIVDSTNENGLGISSLKGPCVKAVYMHTSATPAAGNPNPEGPTGGGTPVGGLDLGTSANYAIGAYSAITGSTGSGSVINGNMFITPNTLSSVTNFPPSTVSGVTDAANAAAVQARIDGNAAFLAGQTRGLAGSTIAAELGGQTLTPGDYQSATSFGLSLTSGNSTLTLNGAGVYLLYSPSTLLTGASGSTDLPEIAFTGGADETNTTIYWIVGSSATINQSVASAGAIFYGNVLAYASITATQPGTIEGRLLAVGDGNGAVTLSDTNTINSPEGAASGGGVIVVQLADNYSKFFTMFHDIASPASAEDLKVDDSALTEGVAYIITTLGDLTSEEWYALGVPRGLVPATGISFIAASVGAGSDVATSRVQTAAATGSNIMTIEIVGTPSLAPDPRQNQGFGAQFILQCHGYDGSNTAPADGTLISLAFLLDNSSMILSGE